MAVEETGMGVVEDKVIKNNYASEYIYNAYKDAKTCGIIETDSAYGTMKIAEPIGVIAAVIPTTNPTSTAIFKTLIALKTRNAIIISPHPRAKKSTIEAAKIVLDAAVAAGADGLMIEVHNDPANALCDGAQSIKPDKFASIMKKVNAIREVITK
jgi:acetaldehyde dehydrogenase/alcohol dehydrogenase